MSSWIKRKLSLVTNSNGTANSSTSPSRSQNPNTIRYEVFKSHWSQVAEIICLKDVDSTCVVVTNETLPQRQPRPVTQDDVDAIRNLLEQMVFLLAEEQQHSDQHLGPILEYLITQGLMGKLYDWYSRSADLKQQIAVNQIKVYEVLISQGEHSLLHHQKLVSPMLKLLASCAEMYSEEVDNHVVLLLNLLCVWISRDSTLLDVFFGFSAKQGEPTNFIIFSLLVGFIHREGSIGQQSRDALLLCVTMSSANERVANYIVSTDFCPVLATGLSALYSSLPRQIDVRTEEWHFFRKQDWSQVPALVNFMKSFEFCNSVVEVAPGVVGESLLNYIYNGFLVSVFGPALHKPSGSEVIVTTAYLNLFLQSVTAPELLQCFLRFLLCHRHDNSLIINTLIQRIGSSSKLAAVSLSLFLTLLDLDCEDLMLHLVFRYLIPCQHILASQHRSICGVDMYCASAHRFINLTPDCYRSQTKVGENLLLSVNETPNESEPPGSENPPSGASITPADSTATKKRSNSRSSAGSTNSDQSNLITDPATMRESGADHGSRMLLRTSYVDYLESANAAITECREACRNWSEPYDGISPPIDSVTELKGLRGTMTPGVHQTSISLLSINEEHGPKTIHAESDPMPIRYDNNMCGSPALHALNATYQALNATAQVLNKKSYPVFSSMGECREEYPYKYKVDEENGVLTNGPADGADANTGKNSGEEGKDLENVEETLDIENEKAEKVAVLTETAEKKKEESANSNPGTDERDEINNDKPLSPLQKVTVSPETEKKEESADPDIDECDKLDNDKPLSPLQKVIVSLETEEKEESTDPDIDERDKLDDDKPLSPLLQSSSVDEFFRRLMESVPVKTRETIEGKGAPSEGKEDILSGERLNSMEEESECFYEGAPSANSDEETSSRSRSIEEDPDDVGDDTMSVNSSFYEADSEYTPAEYSTPSIAPPLRMNAVPYTGPFLSTLFGKVDQMAGNSLYENLLLTGIISRLSCYPQPLLRSFLLNTTVVFHPAVRSLYQILAGVRSRVDAYAVTVDNFPELISRAEKYLLARDSDSEESFEENLVQKSPMPVPRVKTRNTTLGEVFLRRKHRKQPQKVPKLEALLERSRRTFSFGPATGVEGQSMFYAGSNYKVSSQQISKQMNDSKTRNVIFACVILHEFLKELAAISQEHAVTCV